MKENGSRLLDNKKGITILELLISITLISIVVLLLIRVMFSLNSIASSKNYASEDEISRAEIIKNIESDFLSQHLNGLNINTNNNIELIFQYENSASKLIINQNSLTYNNEKYTLNSKNAAYDSCLKYEYQDLDDGYYLLKIEIPVLINNENTTLNDDIILTYLGLKNENSNYPLNFTCSK